jgi:hypothetical protein
MSEQREHLGLEVQQQRPTEQEAKRIPATREAVGRAIYPGLDANGAHVHFEMAPMGAIPCYD